MPSLNVYLDKTLHEQMKAYPGVNWSKVCQNAIRAKLDLAGATTALKLTLRDVPAVVAKRGGTDPST